MIVIADDENDVNAQKLKTSVKNETFKSISKIRIRRFFIFLYRFDKTKKCVNFRRYEYIVNMLLIHLIKSTFSQHAK